MKTNSERHQTSGGQPGAISIFRGIRSDDTSINTSVGGVFMPPSGGIVIGVDGGGTKTVAVALALPWPSDEAEAVPQEAGRCLTGSSNRNSVGASCANDALRSAILGAAAAASRTVEDIRAVSLGLSGVDSPGDARAIEDAVHQWLPAQVPVLVQNDSVAALASGTGGQPVGCVLISGTGSIAYGRSSSGTEARSGGWGPAFLDPGSGYGMGQQLLAAVAKAADGRGEPTAMTELVLRHLELNSPSDLLTWAYSQVGWAPIASLAPLVSTAADGGDLAAQGILDGAVNGLLEMVQAVVRKLELGAETFPVVVAGGGLRSGALLLRQLSRKLALEIPTATVIVPTRDSATGAALLAAESLRADLTATSASPT